MHTPFLPRRLVSWSPCFDAIQCKLMGPRKSSIIQGRSYFLFPNLVDLYYMKRLSRVPAESKYYPFMDLSYSLSTHHLFGSFGSGMKDGGPNDNLLDIASHYQTVKEYFCLSKFRCHHCHEDVTLYLSTHRKYQGNFLFFTANAIIYHFHNGIFFTVDYILKI